MLQAEHLIERVKAYQPSVDPELIQRAYDYSYRMHAGQTRKSGQPYIVHPVSVAGILADLKLDAASVCAG
ncbi:MAG: HD domain-containing protein, partial [Polyangiaceae bacterium]|nr:HD domain-containing protein [Polyangiaceae bacterium]